MRDGKKVIISITLMDAYLMTTIQEIDRLTVENKMWNWKKMDIFFRCEQVEFFPINYRRLLDNIIATNNTFSLWGLLRFELSDFDDKSSYWIKSLIVHTSIFVRLYWVGSFCLHSSHSKLMSIRIEWNCKHLYHICFVNDSDFWKGVCLFCFVSARSSTRLYTIHPFEWRIQFE